MDVCMKLHWHLSQGLVAPVSGKMLNNTRQLVEIIAANDNFLVQHFSDKSDAV